MSHSLLKFDDSAKAFVDSVYVFSVTVDTSFLDVLIRLGVE